MQKSPSIITKFYVAICAATGWFALLLQLYLIIANRKLSVAATVVQFFSFFTILTNILVAVCFTTLLLKGADNSFFTKPKTLTATAVYITIVGAIYNLILRHLWQPQGWQLVADNLLHSLIPILFVGHWLVTVPKNSLQWKNLLPWLIYPFIYLVYVLIRGAFTKLYPYPFVDVATYGFAKVAVNSGWVMLGFVAVSILFISIGKLIKQFVQEK